MAAVEPSGARSRAERRAAQHNTKYKTELCKNWVEKGSCPYGHKCQFAHGPEDMRLREYKPSYKTRPCQVFIQTGHCVYGSRCKFRHGDDDEQRLLNLHEELRLRSSGDDTRAATAGLSPTSLRRSSDDEAGPPARRQRHHTVHLLPPGPRVDQPGPPPGQVPMSLSGSYVSPVAGMVHPGALFAGMGGPPGPLAPYSAPTSPAPVCSEASALGPPPPPPPRMPRTPPPPPPPLRSSPQPPRPPPGHMGPVAFVQAAMIHAPIPMPLRPQPPAPTGPPPGATPRAYSSPATDPRFEYDKPRRSGVEGVDDDSSPRSIDAYYGYPDGGLSPGYGAGHSSVPALALRGVPPPRPYDDATVREHGDGSLELSLKIPELPGFGRRARTTSAGIGVSVGGAATLDSMQLGPELPPLVAGMMDPGAAGAPEGVLRRQGAALGAESDRRNLRRTVPALLPDSLAPKPAALVHGGGGSKTSEELVRLLARTQSVSSNPEELAMPPDYNPALAPADATLGRTESGHSIAGVGAIQEAHMGAAAPPAVMRHESEILLSARDIYEQALSRHEDAGASSSGEKIANQLARVLIDDYLPTGFA